LLLFGEWNSSYEDDSAIVGIIGVIVVMAAAAAAVDRMQYGMEDRCCGLGRRRRLGRPVIGIVVVVIVVIVASSSE